MKVAILLLCVFIGIGYFMLRKYNASKAPTECPSGFVIIDMPDGFTDNVVCIFAPSHSSCIPIGEDNAATRADMIEDELDKNKIEYKRVDGVHSNGSSDTIQSYRRMLYDNTRSVLDGESPKVFMNGYGKANPSPKDVVSDYKWIRTHKK